MSPRTHFKCPRVPTLAYFTPCTPLKIMSPRTHFRKFEKHCFLPDLDLESIDFKGFVNSLMSPRTHFRLMSPRTHFKCPRVPTLEKKLLIFQWFPKSHKRARKQLLVVFLQRKQQQKKIDKFIVAYFFKSFFYFIDPLLNSHGIELCNHSNLPSQKL